MRLHAKAIALSLRYDWAMQSNANSLLLLMLLGCGLGIVGMWLLIRGRWPRRTGNTPHCGKCDYILIGNYSGVCPECGTTITPENILNGERHIRPWRIFVGAVLLFLGLLSSGVFVADCVGHVQWYHYRPFDWVLHDLASATTGVSHKAFTEITRRQSARLLSVRQQSDWVDQMLADLGHLPPPPASGASEAWIENQWSELSQRAVNGSLSDDQLNLWTARNIEILKSRRWNKSHFLAMELRRLLSDRRVLARQCNAVIELGLARQTDATYDAADEALIAMLLEQLKAGSLTDEQKAQFFRSAISMTLKTRSRVSPGKYIPYAVQIVFRCPEKWKIVTEETGRWVDERSVDQVQGSTTDAIGPLPPGHHQMRVQLSVKVEDANLWVPNTPIVKTWDQQFTSDFEVLNQNDPMPDAATLAKCITASVSRSQPGETGWLKIDVFFLHLPVDVDFDVLLRTADGQEYFGCGTGVFKPPSGDDRSGGFECPIIDSGKAPTTMPTAVDVILRSNSARANKRLDPMEIWDGQIIIPNVPVQVRATQPSNH